MGVPGSLPQRIFVLAYNPAKGRLSLTVNLGILLRAAALADLYRSGHLTDERGRATIGVPHPCHDPVLDALLGEIANAKPDTWQHWMQRRQNATIRAVRQQLGEHGWVRLQPHKVLGLFPVTKVTIHDPRVREELLGRVDAALNQPLDRIDPADAATVAIVAAGGLDLVLDRRTRRANKQRIEQLAEQSGPIVPGLHQSIQAAAAGIA
ncbi:GPP34 family phosphoprotein [Plantactinospora sp. BB1]|uniref:GOLPH3/VPS74 family protein n=1 Tax=Plantactinospora sp. BB1 TaxID=2071627 RepID=UPI000D1566A0|nr:GPP34 family phosphoprotein [Plantactinospora sp. BB1]AVT37154.1 GPP34 family phosphoprotein [Plantactinospora sp. BB1]